MKKALLILSYIIISITLVYPVPLEMNFQGRISDTLGVPIEGSRNITFEIYESPAGGARIWFETRTLSFYSGLFNVRLGEVNPIPASIFDGNVFYLQMVFEGENLEPRTALISMPYAFRSQLADTGLYALQTNFDTLGAYYDTTYSFVDVIVWDTLNYYVDFDTLGAYSETTHVHYFDDILGVANDDQIPDDITIFYADSSGALFWGDIRGVPAGIADGDDIDTNIAYWDDIRNIPADIIDGDAVDTFVAYWDSLRDLPAGFADGVDNTGSAGDYDHNGL
ncbi:hypothetical protein JW877_01030, partial [bacterium]|nr:hypothetical protein [bacterium]